MAPKTKDEAIAIIDSSDLVAHTDVLIRLLLPSLSLEFERKDTESPSYFGGLPLLPQDFPWPHWDARP